MSPNPAPTKTLSPNGGSKTIYKNDLTREVEDILELPRHYWRGEGQKIVNAIFQTIAEALQRGETVQIKGFGRLYVRRLGTVGVTCCFPLPTSKHREYITYEKNKVIFEASPLLKKALNEPQP